MKIFALLGFIASVIFVAFIPQQNEFSHIISGFAVAFASYVLLISKTDFSLKALLLLGVSLRVVLIFSFPNLSDDIYRFMWDGNLLHLGENPFAELPSVYVNVAKEDIFSFLYPRLNSPNYYSIYPPFAQLIFYMSTFQWMNTSVVIKILLLLSECLTFWFGIKLLRAMQMDTRNILWYVLNPLIIIEIMGNVHFEGFMVCFFMIFLYYLHKGLLNRAALMFVLSVSAKLVPLLFLPYFLFSWKFKKSLIFYSKIALLTLLIFSPLLLQISGFTNSLDLYFRKFEFNASIYYLIREVGEIWKGYNMIGKIGPTLAISTFGIVMYLAYKVKNFLVFSHWALFVFLLLSTTVHPWYLSLGIILSVFINQRLFILWSFVIILSYSKYGLGETAYYWFVILEYTCLAVYLIFTYMRTKENNSNLSELEPV